jgi:hypothetical protein
MISGEPFEEWPLSLIKDEDFKSTFLSVLLENVHYLYIYPPCCGLFHGSHAMEECDAGSCVELFVEEAGAERPSKP